MKLVTVAAAALNQTPLDWNRNRDNIVCAIERARARLAALRVPGAWDAASLADLGHAVGYQPARPARLLVRQGAGHRLTPLSDIVRFSAADGVVYAHTSSSTPIVDYTLADLEARARRDLSTDDPAAITVERRVSLRFTRQVHALPIVLEGEHVDADALAAQFRREYERLVGAGTAFASAGVELVAVAVEARAPVVAFRGHGETA